MAARQMYTQLIFLYVFLLSTCCYHIVANLTGLELKCGEMSLEITAKRELFGGLGVPFKPAHVRLGLKSKQQRSCVPRESTTESDITIFASLHDCGTESSVDGDWLVYSNHLLLFPAVVPTSKGISIVRAPTTVIPIQCLYKSKQAVSAEPLTPTWLPMTSAVRAFGLLHFSIQPMTDGCASVRNSLTYQQGEAVFLEASVEIPLHPPLQLYVDSCIATLEPDPSSLPSYAFIANNGCLIDSVRQESPSKFFPRKQENRLCFSVQAFRFDQDSFGQMFISCHLHASLKENSQNHLNKACFFNQATSRWHTTEGDSTQCSCCNSGDCLGLTEKRSLVHAGRALQKDQATERGTDIMIGPLHTLPRSHWKDHFSLKY